MKKRTLWLLCGVGVMVGLFLSCEIPQALTIKGKPGVYIPLGDPLANVKDEDRLENYISRDKIDEMMDNPDADKKVAIYDYWGTDVDSTDVQAYIVHYPIAEMKLDLEEYINDATKDAEGKDFSYRLPDEFASAPSTYFGDGLYFTEDGWKRKTVDMVEKPLFAVPLSDMAKLVKEVIGGPFGIEMDLGNTTSFRGNVWVKIPAFGIDEYIEGEMEGGKLRFADTPEDGKFIPKKEQGGNLNEKNELEIYVKVTGPCSGTIVPEMVFEWDEAVIYTITNESLKGNYQFNFKNDLGEYLGEGVSFKEVTGYIYVNNVKDAKLLLDANGVSLLREKESALINKNRPTDIFTDQFTGTIPESSLGYPISMADVLNDDSILEYQIKIPEMRVENTPDGTSRTITIDMVILLPLEFKVTTSSIPGYVKLELNNIFPKPGKEDLFLRDSKDDGLLSNLTSMTILFKKFQNDIIGGNVSILVSSVSPIPSNSYYNLLDFNKDGKLTLNMKELPFPFTPEFGIVIKKDDNESYGTLKILRQANSNTPGTFNFTLAVEARADLNYTIDF